MDDESLRKFAERVRRRTARIDGASFINYDAVGGVWEFRVDHF